MPLETESSKAEYIQPISLILLDINMPILTGYDVVPLIKKRFEAINENKSDLFRKGTLKVKPAILVRPMICYLSQYSAEVMKTYISEAETTDCYLEKPLPLRELQSLLRLI